MTTPGRLGLDIAGIPLALSWGDDVGSVDVPTPYRPFLAAEPGGLPVDLSTEDVRENMDPPAFDNRPIWSLHRQASGSRFDIFTSYPELRRSLTLDHGLGKAQLAFQASDHDPFIGPTLELITILRLARVGGVILHGCGIEQHGRGTAFIGVSGAGKSTLSRLWANVEGARILSDDRVIVRREAGGFRLYGSPWHGDAQFAAPGGVPLERMFFIRHGTENVRTPLRPSLSVRELLCCSFPPFWDAAGMQAALGLLVDLATAVPCEELHIVPDPAVIDFLQGSA
jgi:hypothetical protein